jgi:hypothetical protein
MNQNDLVCQDDMDMDSEVSFYNILLIHIYLQDADYDESKLDSDDFTKQCSLKYEDLNFNGIKNIHS